MAEATSGARGRCGPFPLAAADGGGGGIGPQAEVGDLQGDDLTRAGPYGEHKPQDGLVALVALVAQVGAATGLEHRPQLVVGQGLHHGLFELGGAHAEERVGGLFPPPRSTRPRSAGRRGDVTRRSPAWPLRPRARRRTPAAGGGPRRLGGRPARTRRGRPAPHCRRTSTSPPTCARRAGGAPRSRVARRGPRRACYVLWPPPDGTANTLD